MSKKAYVFPGQGSQFTGMGKALYENNPIARSVMEKSDEILGFRLTDIMFEGTAEQLKQTKVTQSAVFIHSLAAELSFDAPAPDMVAGHSLGELSALVACHAISLEDGIRLVAARAEAMQKCCESHPGGMAAIIGLESELIEQVCKEISDEAHTPLVAANYNCPGQIVISGGQEAILKACEALKERGAKRALPLPVSGAFHSPLMEDAREELAKAIEQCTFHKPQCPIYQNVSAKAETEPERIKENLLCQLTSPVRWTESVQNMIKDGALEFTEFGPGKVLQGLVSRIGGADLSTNGIQ